MLLIISHVPVGVRQVRVHYTGKLKDGTEFDTSAGRGESRLMKYVRSTIHGWVVHI